MLTRINHPLVWGVYGLAGEAEARCRALIEDHYTATGSLHAAAILNDWETRKLAICHIVPFPPATGMEAQEKRA